MLDLKSRNVAYILLGISALIWGAATPIIRSTVQQIPPFTFLMLRFWITLLFCIPSSIWILSRVKLDLKRFLLIFKSSIIGHVLSLSFVFIGLTKIESIEGSLITTFFPLIVMIFGYFLLKENISKRELEGTLLAFLGAVLIIFEPFITGSSILDSQRLSFFGSVLFLIGVVLDGLYSVYVKKNISEDRLITPYIQIVFSFCFASLIFSVLGFSEQYFIYRSTEINHIRDCTQTDIDKYNYSKGTVCDEKGCLDQADTTKYFCIKSSYRVDFGVYLINQLKFYIADKAIYGVFYMAVFSGLIAYTLYNYGLSKIEATEASVFYYLQPVFGIPLGVFLLSERITLVFVISALLISIGVYFVEKRK
jgi:drug/metabolite transporter (DMT)-like permease